MSESLPNCMLPIAPASRCVEVTRILLLEDSPGEAELFCHALVLAWALLESKSESPRPGIDVHCTAQDALEALKRQVASEAGLPDLIVLDMDLPGGTSLTFLRELRRDSRLTNLPVIAMAWTDDQAIVRSQAGLGVVGYVIKPMLLADLVTIIGGVCREILTETPRQDLEAVARRQPA